MRITATATFRNQHSKGDIILRGSEVDVEDSYGQTLIQSGLAVSGKMLDEYNNKMLKEFAANKMPTKHESPEERTGGHEGPGPKAETPEERTQGYSKGDKKAQDEEKDQKIPDFPEGEPMKKSPVQAQNVRPLTTHQIGKAGVEPWKNDPTVPASMVEQEPEGGGLKVKREQAPESPQSTPQQQQQPPDDRGSAKRR